MVIEGRGTEGVKSAPDSTLGFLVRPYLSYPSCDDDDDDDDGLVS